MLTVARLLITIQHFMENEVVSLLQVSATGPYHEPDESNPQPHFILL
jgi:hypothetical protein